MKLSLKRTGEWGYTGAYELNLALLLIAIPSVISIIAYFIPSVREGKRIFSPMPGMIALRIGLEGRSRRTTSKSTMFILNLFILLFAVALVFGYKIIIEALVSTLLPKSAARGPVFVPIIPGVTIPLNQMVTLVWIIAVSIALHELAHYWSAVRQGIKVKGGGIGWFLFFPIAFVEPDEEELMRAPLIDRIRVYSAGPATNMALALLTLLLIQYNTHPGIYVVGVERGSVAWKVGIKPGDVIVEINGVKVTSLKQLGSIIEKAGRFELVIDRNGKLIHLEVVKKKGRLGIYVTPWAPSGLFRSLPPETVMGLVMTLFWMNGINTGLAVINALPLFITDGGKVFLDIGSRFKKLEKPLMILQAVTVIMVVEVLINSLIMLR
ncbi:hypothetical protein IPA_04005 [Ignicoccus pacificus DSM 13166]|uniref:PDZ domain-containing protein n=1 Tax=Ignicoccus pacificus DSM 13166 TaxID=940294 RepID=A0A977KB16_9CREN|nr:hypothetical protein IPA_04005 [Ignicoccus pacificus DSM 13166]